MIRPIDLKLVVQEIERIRYVKEENLSDELGLQGQLLKILTYEFVVAKSLLTQVLRIEISFFFDKLFITLEIGVWLRWSR